MASARDRVSRTPPWVLSDEEEEPGLQGREDRALRGALGADAAARAMAAAVAMASDGVHGVESIERLSQAVAQQGSELQGLRTEVAGLRDIATWTQEQVVQGQSRLAMRQVRLTGFPLAMNRGAVSDDKIPF